MAKITHKGMWIELKSLDKDAKSKYILCNVFLFAGALLFGVHLTAIGGFGFEVSEEVSPSPALVIVRVLSLTFMLIAAWLYKEFLQHKMNFSTDIMNLYLAMELSVFFLLVFLFLFFLRILTVSYTHLTLPTIYSV